MNNEELQDQEEIQEVIEEDNNSVNENIVQTPSSFKESEVLSSTTTPTSDSIILVDGKEVSYYEESYKQQLITNAYLLAFLILIMSFLILRWIYGGIKKDIINIKNANK